ncbi:MAG: N-acetylmuramic acid 6-phosphate etherase [Erysipelotrichaceae bacterium]
MNLKKMTTEQRNPRTMNLDELNSLEIVTLMNSEDALVAQAISKKLPNIAKAVDWFVEAYQKGGRIFYVGAGTSGRLGVLDAAECLPTFGIASDRVVALIAGGSKAMLKAVEGAEDDCAQGQKDLEAYNLNSNDLVIGLAASGRTPYVQGALNYANELNCNSVAIACNENTIIGSIAKLAIEVDSGAEVLTGSTRLKAGTAQKLILNMLSTASMVQLGKAYSNLMVDVIQSNEKLRLRAINIVVEATGCDSAMAAEKLRLAQGQVKKAVVMILAACDLKTANQLLEKSNGKVKLAIK